MGRIRVAISTVGCRANQADSSALRRAMLSSDVEFTDDSRTADVVVINTCCVTAEAERDCRKMARRALRESASVQVILTGCAVSAVRGFGKDIDDRVAITGGGDCTPEELAELIQNVVGAPLSSRRSVAKADAAPSITRTQAETSARIDTGRTRALLKIQNGCDHHCAYCIVPLARGAERSMPIDEVLANVDRIKDVGFRELVLTGVQIGAWGKDLPNLPRLPQLIATVADRFAPGRVRLSSVEPWSVDDALIEVVAGHERVCPHLHMPLQSGDDRILEAMGRGYTRGQFARIAHRAVAASPDLSFGTDVLCGFPGEDEPAFGNTLALLNDIPLTYLHAFPYSPREGTRAASMLPKSDRTTAKERVRRTLVSGDAAESRFKISQLGKVREVVIESGSGDRSRGLTDNFLQVTTRGTIGALVMARLSLGATGGPMVAEPFVDPSE